ncbi:hypothetical protein [Natrinema halophilum]|uniref:Uncharacterized protein n=1 Tax=Natrinema halophilum TaxID=1699371 RepID=A0A7D5H4K2_9EURY|nr:hypothetical protein [Natrinema halophilum]QLG50691.1 hypothetical protein HYG82_18545 [Natrinema halophilum]
MAGTRSGESSDRSERRAALAWLMTIALGVLAISHGFTGSYRWFVFTGFAVAIALLPVAVFRDPLAIPPWDLLILVLLPVVDATVYGESILTGITTYVAVAAVALIVAVEIDRLTAVRMSHSFAVVLVSLTTLAVAGGWNVAQWVADVAFGTDYLLDGRSQDAANRALMIEFAYAAVAGFLAGILFDRSFRSYSESVSERVAPADDSGSASKSEPIPALIRDRLDIPDETVRRFSRGMQIALAGLLLFGLFRRDLTTVVNAGVALAITFLPAILERDARLPLEPGLVFWLTVAVFLHALGSAGVYALVGQWDSLTHTISASIVAAAGYAVVRAIDLHTDDVYLPTTVLFAFILVFVLAFGVVWELLEFAIDESARLLGFQAVVAQYGLSDTIVDLMFDSAGAVVAAVWGSFYLTDLSRQIASRLEGEPDR